MINKKKALFNTLVFLIIVAAFLLRFYKLHSWLYFMIDEERDAFIVKKILIEKKPVLIGGAVPGGIYLGPAFYYLSSLIMFLSKLNPLGEGIAASFLGFCSVLFLFFLAKNFFNKRTAFFALIFYSFSFLVIIYNRIWWPLVLSPFISLLTYYFLFKIISAKKNKKAEKIWLVIPLSLILVLGVQSDPASFALVLLTIILWITFKLPFKSKKVFQAGFLFFLSHISLLIFDLRHNFLNLRALLKLFTFSVAKEKIDLIFSLKGLFLAPKVLSRTLFISGPNDLIKQISPCEQYLLLREKIPFLLLLFSFFILTIFIYNFFKTRERELGSLILASHFIIILAGIVLYNFFFPGYTHEWFFYTFFPGYCLISGWFFSKLYQLKFFKPFVALFLFFFIFQNSKNFITGKNSFNLKDKMKAVDYVSKEMGNEEFFLDSLGSCFKYGGYRYLFWLKGREPSKSYMDYLYGGWFYPQNKSQKPKKGALILNQADNEDMNFWQQYHAYQKKIKQIKKFGDIEVWFVSED